MESTLNKILLIHQDERTIDLLRELLTAEGYIITVAKDGETGKQIALRNIPDLILLDVEMYPIDGVEICHLLRSIPQLKRTLIAFFTKQKEDFIHEAGLSAGADDFIIQPINNIVLTYRIKAMFRGKVRLAG